MKEDTGLVNGYKIRRSDSLNRILIGIFYSLFVRLIFTLKIKDPDCDFRLLRRSVLPPDLESSSGAICVELVKKIQNTGLKIEQVPVAHYPRRHGESRFFNSPSIFRTFRELAAFRWKLSLHGRK